MVSLYLDPLKVRHVKKSNRLDAHNVIIDNVQNAQVTILRIENVFWNVNKILSQGKGLISTIADHKKQLVPLSFDKLIILPTPKIVS